MRTGANFAIGADRARRRCSCFRPRLSVLSEQAVEFGPGCRVGKAVELAVVRNKLGGAHEAAPGGARQPTAEADAPYPSAATSATVSPIGLPITKLTGFGATA